MAIGQSRRIVVDVDDIEFKRSLYSALAQDGRTLKEWFVDSASHYLRTRARARQLGFSALRIADTPGQYADGETGDAKPGDL